MTMRALRECGILKYFRVPGVRAHVRFLDHLIQVWDPNRKHLQVRTYILKIDVKDIYFMTRLS